MYKHHYDKAKTSLSSTFLTMHWANVTSVHPPIWFISGRCVTRDLQPRREVHVAFIRIRPYEEHLQSQKPPSNINQLHHIQHHQHPH